MAFSPLPPCPPAPLLASRPDSTFDALAARTPTPPHPVEPFDLAHPAVPPALDGLTVLHLADLHTRRRQLSDARSRALLHALASTPCDVLAITGDLMDEPGHEAAALDTLAALSQVWRPRLGAHLVFGNHDSPHFRRLVARHLPRINLAGHGHGITDLTVNGATLRLIGLDFPEDPLRILAAEPPPAGPTLRLALAHYPSCLVTLAAAGVPLALAAHTHAGQVRLSPRFAPHTSSDLPPHLAAGILRCGDTLCAITRGVGDGVIDHLRLNCPRQLPLYTLRHAPLPALLHARAKARPLVTQIRAW
jgi:predicted MPP superfamily phosphohydrolase